MTIAFGSQGTTPTGTTLASGVGTSSVAPAQPASLATGDLVILLVVNKVETEIPTTPSGWTLAGTIAGGGGTAGSDAGPVRLSCYYREKDASWSSVPSVSVGSANASWAQAFRYTKDPANAWDVAVASGARTTASTSFSVSVGTNPGITANDMCIAAAGLTSDSATWSSESIAATGVTFGTMTERSEPKTTLGNDLGGAVWQRPVSSGTASANATLTGTLTSSTGATGVAMLIRLREVAAAPPPQTVSPDAIASDETFGTLGIIGGELFKNTDFETDVSFWETNPGLGVYTAATFAQTTEQAHGGTSSLKATWPTASGDTWVNHVAVSVVTGQSYVFDAWVYVPTGSPTVRLEIAFRLQGDRSTIKDGWQHLFMRWTSDTTGNVFVGVATTNTTAGQVAYIDDVHGTALAGQLIVLTSMTSAEAFGSPTATNLPPAQTCSPTGIASAQAFGNPGVTVAPPSQSLSPTGISSAEVFGTPVRTSTLTVSPVAIASLEALGAPQLAPLVVVSPVGVASLESVSAPVISRVLTASPVGIVSTEVFGTPAITTALTVSPTGISSGQAFGVPVATVGGVTVSPTGIASVQAFGVPSVAVGAVTVSPTGIASLEVFGIPVRTSSVTISPTGIASQQTFGVPAIGLGAVTVSPTGIVSEEIFGNPSITRNIFVSPFSIQDAVNNLVVNPDCSRTVGTVVNVDGDTVPIVTGWTHSSSSGAGGVVRPPFLENDPIEGSTLRLKVIDSETGGWNYLGGALASSVELRSGLPFTIYFRAKANFIGGGGNVVNIRLCQGNALSMVYAGPNITLTNEFTDYVLNGTGALDGSTSVLLYMNLSVNSDVDFQVARAMVVPGRQDVSYFDGDSDTRSYWQGEPGNSKSTLEDDKFGTPTANVKQSVNPYGIISEEWFGLPALSGPGVSVPGFVGWGIPI